LRSQTNDYDAEEHAMGESQATLFQPNFNRSVHVEARADRVTADAGALLIRELVERSGLRQQLEKALVDTRAPERTTHPFMELLLTWLLQDVQGYPDQLDVSLLRDDPLFRLSVSSRRGERALLPARGREPDGLASQPTMSRTLTMLSTEDNRSGLGEVLAASGDVLRLRAKTERVLDLDSLPIEVHGAQTRKRLQWALPHALFPSAGVAIGRGFLPGGASARGHGTHGHWRTRVCLAGAA
jgi:hypothetical protein